MLRGVPTTIIVGVIVQISYKMDRVWKSFFYTNFVASLDYIFSEIYFNVKPLRFRSNFIGALQFCVTALVSSLTACLAKLPSNNTVFQDRNWKQQFFCSVSRTAVKMSVMSLYYFDSQSSRAFCLKFDVSLSWNTV